jgi:DNA-binding beta-propeller fold protein YncE
MRHTDKAILLILAAVPLFLGSTCDGPPAATIGNLLPNYFWPIDFVVSCENNSGLWRRSVTAVAPDGSSNVISDEITSERPDDCWPSNTKNYYGDQADPRPFSTTPVMPASTGGGTLSKQPERSANGPAPDSYPFGQPLPFTPWHSPAEISRIRTACDPNATFFGVNHRAGTVTRYSLCTGRPGTVIRVASNPLQAAISQDGTLMLVTSYDSAINFISTSANQVIATLATPTLHPNGVAISPDGTRAYVTNYDNIDGGILVIDVPARRIAGTIPTGAFPKSIVLTPDGSQAWVNFSGNSAIYVIDTLTGTLSATLGGSGDIHAGMAFNPTGTRAFVAMSPNQLLVYDTATLDRVASVTVATQPVDVVVTADGERVYVGSYATNNISLVDARKNGLIRNIPTRHPIHGLTVGSAITP